MALVCCFNAGARTCTVAETPSLGQMIQRSVGAGGANHRDDTLVVQSLLNACRPVVDFGPLLAVDGLVGPKTVHAIKTFQSQQFGFADGRVDPGHRTLARLNVLAPADMALGAPLTAPATSVASFAPAHTASTVTQATPRKLSPKESAVEATPRAIFWVTAAIVNLTAIRSAIMAGLDLKLLTPFSMTIVNTHFHLDKEPGNIIINLDRIVVVYRHMLKVFAKPDDFYTEGPATDKSPFADAVMGGFHLGNIKITFRTKYPDCGPNVRSAMLVHEGAHFCGKLNEINHFAMEFPAPDGQPQDGSSRNYAQLTTSEAMRNASSYAAFAIHAATMVDHRFGAADLTK